MIRRRSVGGRPRGLGWGELAFEERPLGVRETGVEFGDVHRPDRAAPRMERALPLRAVKSCSQPFSPRPGAAAGRIQPASHPFRFIRQALNLRHPRRLKLPK